MLEMVITARPADLGHGLTVKRVLPYAKRRMVGPWIFVDHAGPVTMAPEDTSAADVRPHPHIGLSTVSYLLSGQVMHRDSLGMKQSIVPGDVNWMTAGRGISHSERFSHPESFAGGGLELMQLWVALPEADEETDPAFTHYPAADLPVQEADGVWMRLIAGSAYGMTSPVRTHSPLFYLHTEWQAGASKALPGGHSEQAVYVAHGEIEHAGQTYVPGQLLVFGDDADAVITAREKSTLMIFGGEPLGERHVFWNFVSSRKERIEQAKEDWQAGRIPLPPGDDKEWIPLPG
ncbi:redox-sensitive bicupin YhaK (pirin superfamily) [Hydrogenophaga palleronii]|uniref:Redox-sensitive bicupin YhaK (Pirin superfamily) n=1 Tax=Hydrogenophaga palleronii TaxID=65655 RepID=A0ABU1WT35_9BURK|nr:pirin family protein [Hydrogenophaga palleronii]MDR7152116.1 redox-sensitive bicupin YhaK (pirin superfamily) [Hydrogenophaga palleronii]